MKKTFKKILPVVAILILLGSALPSFELAQSDSLVGPPKLTVPFPGQTDPITGPRDYIRTVYQFALGFGALLAMVMIVIGGVQYTLSEAVTSKEDAKDRIVKAIWGLILLLAATFILFTVNPDIPALNEPGVGQLPSAPPASIDPSFAPPALCGNGTLDQGEPCDLSAPNGDRNCGSGLVCRNDCRCRYGN
ncbi:MAG: pilin [Patescibacteria group bacterium]